MATISELETKVDELAVATDGAKARQSSAALADQALWSAVVERLQEATREASRAHARLVGHDSQVRNAADEWVAKSSERAPKVSEIEARYTSLRSDLASRLFPGVIAFDDALDAIDALGDTLRTAVDAATVDVDNARDAWIDAHAEVTKKTLAVERIRARISSLPGEFSEAIRDASASMAEARRLMAREEAASNRAATTHAYFARRQRDRLNADFGLSDDAIDSNAGSATAFTLPWETAWDELVDAQEALHDLSLELQKALVVEAEAIAALREHERGLPYDPALEPFFP